MIRRHLITLTLAALCLCGVARAQTLPPSSVSSHYLSVGHWAYRYIDLLVARGKLTSLQPLVQPYRRIDVVRAVQAAQRGQLDDSERAWLEVLEEEFGAELAAAAADTAKVYLKAAVDGGATGVTSRHRDVRRPEGDPTAFPFLQAGLAADFPLVTAALRFRWDRWYLNDPQFPDGVGEDHSSSASGVSFQGRVEEGYAELQIPYFRLLAGRLYRNWGLPGQQGMLISAYPYSYDQIGYRIGTDKLSVTGFVAQLDEWEGSIKRWHSAHRLDWRINDKFALALGETTVYGGENRSFDFRQSLPIAVWLVGGWGQDYREGPNSNNSFFEVEFWGRPTPALTLYGEIMIDDFPTGGGQPGWGLALGFQLPHLGSTTALRLDYTLVTAFTYRSPVADYERYTFRDLGLGHDLADFDQLVAQLDWFPHRRLLLSPQLLLLRWGEGNILDPWDSSDQPAIFLGQVETMLRLALGGQWRVPLAWIEWSLGENFVWNAGHQPGVNTTEFVAQLKAMLTWRTWGRL
jgi:hypothetical protein